MRLPSLPIPLMIAMLMLSACTTPVVTPRSYLDDETAATVTMAAEPWIFFTAEAIGFAGNERDYMSLYAFDINRMGAHRQYLAILVSNPPAAAATSPLTLQLQGGGQRVALQPTTESLRDLGLSKPPAPSYLATARWWYFPVGKDILTTVVRSSDLTAAIDVAGKRVTFSTWRDGSADIDRLNAALP